MADGQTAVDTSKLTPAQVESVLRYAYPDISQTAVDLYKANPSWLAGINLGGNQPGQAGGLVNMLQAFQQQNAATAGGQAGTAAGGAAGGVGGGGGGGWGAGGGGQVAGGGSYFGGATQMANGSTYVPGASANLILPGGGALSPAQTQQVMGLYSSYEGGNAQAGQALLQWLGGMGMSPAQLNTAVSNLRAGTGPNAPQQSNVPPESLALGQMAQIDPASEALRQAVAQSYLTPLQQAAQPTAGQFQTYLDLYRQVDPTSAAARQQLGQDLAAQEALGTQLDPATQRQIEQATRIAQGARGNVYGTPQLTQEAMTTGEAGLALQQQRQQALLGYLGSGQTMGDVAMNLYNQQQAQLRAAQGAAVGYLGSGQTPYQAGAGYLSMAQQNAAMAAQGGPQYNPQALGQQYTGAGTPSFPQYGLDVSQLAGNWYNNINQANLQAYGLQQAYSQKSGGGAAGAGIGALGGAASGALAGSAVPGIGTLAGAAIGAIGGAAKGYFS